ncbi:hypothetical protein Tco_1313105 [Tanacetum coccineum]
MLWLYIRRSTGRVDLCSWLYNRRQEGDVVLRQCIKLESLGKLFTMHVRKSKLPIYFACGLVFMEENRLRDFDEFSWSSIDSKRSPHLTPPAPVLTVDEADDMILQDTIQVSLAEQKSREEQEARENVQLVKEHLAAEEIEKMVEEPVNVIDDSSIPRNDQQDIPDTRFEPRSDKESPEVKIIDNAEEEITNVVIPVNVNEEEEEITDEVYELKRREKGKIVEESRSTPFPSPIRSPRIHDTLVSSDTEKLQELTAISTPSSSSPSTKLFLSRKSFNTLADHLQEVMVESLPIMVDKHIKEQVTKQVPEQVKAQVPVYAVEGLILERQQDKEEMAKMIAKAIRQELRSYMSGHILHVHPAQPTTISAQEQQYQLYLSMKDDLQLQHEDIAIWLALKMKFERLQVPTTTCRTPVVRLRDQDDPHDDAHPEGENNDDEIPSKQVSQEIMEEVSLTIDEAKLNKIADEILRQRCNSGDEHQYHIDQMKNFLESDIIWESRKEILVSPHPRKATPLVQSCQRDLEAPALSLINQDLLYLKKGSSGPEKIVLSLHKFPAVIFNDDDIEEQTSRWVNKCVKKFNPYARYGVEHWKNPHAKIFYIRKQKEPGKPKEVVYSNSKIIQVIKTYWELGHEHKFITEIVARRANECIVSITEPDFKNLNKNDIEDMYLLIMNGKLGVESYQQKVNLTTPTIFFPRIEKHKMFSIIHEPVYGIIYKNSKKEKRVMRHSEVHKFCDATLNKVLKGLKSYNNDVKYGYIQRELTKEDVEYMQLFEEEIEERLKHCNQMRRWEMYVNERPLGLRRECPE